MSFTLTLEQVGPGSAVLAIRALSELDEQQLLTDIAFLGENQTRRRIETEKTAPDGSAWKPPLDQPNTLFHTGRNLHDSIASHVSGRTAEWGSSWQFAHVHQDGMTIKVKNAPMLRGIWRDGSGVGKALEVTIPARPFVGLSAENGREIEDLVTDFLGALL